MDISSDVIYLDYNDSTPCDPRVVEAMEPYFERAWANPSSRSHELGREAFAALEAARSSVASSLGAQSATEIFFTSGATEANNLALVGAARALIGRGRHIVTQSTEHPSVLAVLRALRGEGWELTEIGVDREGRINLESLESAIREDTVMLSLMLANNETGALQPVREAAELYTLGVPLHLDGASGAFVAPFLQPDLAWDFRLPLVKSINASGHKYGLVYPGVGWVMWRSHEDLP